MNGRGLLVGRYELRDVLGFGGMAEVRDGWDTRLNRAVAIKLLHPGLSSQADIRERFKVEACAAASLSHPNIVGVYDFGDQDDMPFIVMERLPGDTLGDLISRGPLPQAHTYAALSDVLAALTEAHGAGMLHRDIKPGNVLLTASGTVKVADFGIVKTPGAVYTTTGQIVGTLAYLSPDRLAGKPASVADDLYAAGVLAYEAVTGRKPFTQEDIAPLARAIIEDNPPAVVDLRPDVDPRLADVIERAMSKDPLRRFDSADSMQAALGRGGGISAPAGAASMSSPPGRPPTLMMDRPPETASDFFAAAPTVRLHKRSGVRKAVGALAVVGAIAVAALAFAVEPFSDTPPSAPEAVDTSTATPTNAPPVSSMAVPAPALQPPPPPPVIEQATQQEQRGNGNGNGNGNGHGNKKPR